MGLSIAGSGAIIFVAFIVALASWSGAFFRTIETFDTDLGESVDTRISKQQTAVEILSVNYQRAKNQTLIEVRNIGSETLNSTKSNIMVDGFVVPNDNISYDVFNREGFHWPPQAVLEIRLHDVDLEIKEDISNRVELKVDRGITIPGSINSNSYYTYVIEEAEVDQKGDVVIYDQRSNLIHRISTEEEQLHRATDLSSTDDNLFVIDDNARVLEYNILGENEVIFIEDEESLSVPHAISVTEENPENYVYILDNNTDIHRYHFNGTYHDTPVSGLEGAIDLYVTDHIFVVNSTGGTIDRYSLNGTQIDEPFIDDNLENPTNISVSDQYFENPYIYVVDEKSRIEVFDTEGVHKMTIDDQLGSNIGGIDINGKIYVSNGFNGWFSLYLGQNIKLTLQNGISEYEII